LTKVLLHFFHEKLLYGISRCLKILLLLSRGQFLYFLVLFAQIMQLYLVPVFYTVLADLPKHTCRHRTTWTTALDAPLCDRLAHFYHRALLWSIDLSLAADADCVVPGLFYGNKVNFVLKLAVDVVQKGVPFFLREFEPFGQIVVLEKVFVFETCTIN
jgi:hypothetical protein